MKKIISMIIFFSYNMAGKVQNVGIGTSTPQAYGHGITVNKDRNDDNFGA
jgi:hypothetical protein